MSYSWLLPVSKDVCETVVSGPELELSQLSQPELASLVYLQNLPKLSLQIQAAEDLEKLFAQTIQISRHELQAYLEVKYDNSVLSRGVMLSTQYGIHFMDQTEVASRRYLQPDGSWDFSYGQRWQSLATPYQMVRHDGVLLHLSDSQRRIMDAEMAMPDDVLGSQSNAGTGKTTVLYEMVERIAVRDLKSVTVLADQPQKHRPLLQKLGKKKYQAHKNRIHLLTYIDLAMELLAGSNRRLVERFRVALAARYSATVLCERAQLADPGRRGVDQLAAQSWEIVRTYCNSLDPVISERHIPRSKSLHMSKIEAAAALDSAVRVWNAMVNLAHPDMPLRGFHLVKLLGLSNKALPERYGTILIDELHDAPRVMVDVLQRSGLPLRMLGDRYQNFRGLDLPFSGTLLTCEMSVSLRAGTQMADYVNPLLYMHPLRSTAEFSADARKTTEFHEYRADGLPQEPAVMPAPDEWGVVDVLIRGRRQGRVVDVFDPGGSLSAFIKDCKELLKYGRGSTHGALRRYDSWDSVARAMIWSPAFQRVEEWLKNGDNFDLSYRSVPEGELIGRPLNLITAMLHDIKSFELPIIALPETLFYLAREGSQRELSRTLSMLYTAVTRGAERVYLPDSHKDWLAYLNRPVTLP